MDLFTEQLKRERFLLVLHGLADGQTGKPIKEEDLMHSMQIESDQFHKARLYLTDEGFIKGTTFGTVGLTPIGRKEAERIMTLSYKEKSFRVLWTIKELTNGSLTKLVLSEDVARMLAIEPREIYPIMNDLDERGLITALNEAVVMLPAGLEALESRDATSSQQPTSSNVFNINLHGDNYGGIQQGTHNSTQNISVTTETPIIKIIPQLDALVRAAEKAEDFLLKQEVVGDLNQALEMAHCNAQRYPGDMPWQFIQAKLTAAKTAMEMVGYAYRSLPFWTLIWHYFTQKLS